MLAALLSRVIFLQADAPVEMADTMRSEGKIYVVVAIILTVLASLFVYLFFLDRRIRKTEREVEELLNKKG